MPLKGEHQSVRARLLIGLAARERMAEEGWRPFQKTGGWSDAVNDEERMRRWREELR